MDVPMAYVVAQTVFSGLLVIFTALYVYWTRELWRASNSSLKATRDSVDLARQSLEAVRRATYGSTLQGIAINHREIAFQALGSETLMRTFMPARTEEQPREPLTAQTRLFASVLINHAETCFEHVRFETIPREFAAPLMADIERVFGLYAIQLRWEESRLGIVEEFRKFGDAAVEKSKKREREKK